MIAKILFRAEALNTFFSLATILVLLNQIIFFNFLNYFVFVGLLTYLFTHVFTYLFDFISSSLNHSHLRKGQERLIGNLITDLV